MIYTFRTAQRIFVTAVGLLATVRALDESIQYFKARYQKIREDQAARQNAPKIIVIDHS